MAHPAGEGVIHNIRDARYGIDKVAAKKRKWSDEPPEVLLDEGVSDKRFTFIESEFAQVFRVVERSGNTLSPVLRLAWDGVTLSIPIKNNGEIASNPHVTVIGHITKAELTKFTNSPELLNGFANRYLWCATYRTKEKPFSQCVDWTKHEDITRYLRDNQPIQSRRGRKEDL